MILTRVVIPFAILLSLPKLALSAGISVDDWRHLTTVDVDGERDASGTFEPSTPFAEIFSAQLSNSTAFSSVSASWDTQGFLNFLVEGEHACEGSPFARCSSGGSINFSPQTDSIITISSTYNYEFAPGDREAVVTVSVNQSGMSPLLRFFRRRLTLGGDTTGQIVYQSDPTLLLAGVDYVFFYSLQLSNFSGSPTDLSHGDGFVRLEISPVPAPATGALLFMASPLLLLRRSRRRM